MDKRNFKRWFANRLLFKGGFWLTLRKLVPYSWQDELHSWLREVITRENGVRLSSRAYRAYRERMHFLCMERSQRSDEEIREKFKYVPFSPYLCHVKIPTDYGIEYLSKRDINKLYLWGVKKGWVRKGWVRDYEKVTDIAFVHENEQQITQETILGVMTPTDEYLKGIFPDVEDDKARRELFCTSFLDDSEYDYLAMANFRLTLIDSWIIDKANSISSKRFTEGPSLTIAKIPEVVLEPWDRKSLYNSKVPSRRVIENPA